MPAGRRGAQPAVTVGTEPLDLDQLLGLQEDGATSIEIAHVEMGLGQLQHGEDPAVEHRLGGRRRQLAQLREGAGAIAQLPVGDGLGHRELAAQDRHVGHGGGMADT